MKEGPWRAADLLPHTGGAVLLDEVLACSDTGLTASVAIRADTAFLRDQGVPAHVGLEYMAQACGAFSGLTARRGGAPPKMGFILGTRRYRATRPWFAIGSRLEVRIDLVYRDGEVGVFDCAIREGNETVAEAQLIVAEPNDDAALLSRANEGNDGQNGPDHGGE